MGVLWGGANGGGGGGGAEGVLWAGANGVGVIPFCVPENRGLHKIAYLRGHVFLCLPVSFPQKKKQHYQQPSWKCCK